MRAQIVIVLAATLFAGRAVAVDPPSCAVPDNLLFMDNNLKRVATAVGKERHLAAAVLGTGSSTLAGTDGPNQAYPARLGQALNQMLPNIAVRVVSRTQGGQTADIMRRSMKDLIGDEKPDLVIWQTGTVDAIRRVEVDEFRTALETGVERLQAAGADVILMNMQYSPRTESMIAVGPYVDEMRAVAEERAVPLFDRFAIMRYWSDEGTFDLNAAGRNNDLARRVHDCLGRALASLIVESGHLQAFVSKTGR
jgi:hypothetical protein